MRVLLPIAEPCDVKLILDFVANYRWPPHTLFKIIHVLGSSATEEEAAAAKTSAETLLAQVRSELSMLFSSSEITSEVILGQAVYEIIETAKKWKANMIVMGYRTRPVGHISPIGSVSNGVVTQAPCSVVIIRPPENSYDPETQRQAALAQTKPRLMA